MNQQINNRYILQETIGTGGMGTVFKAYDRLTKETIALKQVRIPTRISTSDSQTRPNTEHLHLANEFRTLASLRHPYIISVIDYGFDEKHQPHFTMTLLEDAQNLLEACRNQPLATQISIINQMLLALSYLHQRGIVHRDIKPSNIFVTNQQVKVLDFGLSVSTSIAKGRVGTLAYMAPETLKNEIAIAESDLYSVGILLYQIFTGQLPYDPQDIVTRMEGAIPVTIMSGHPLETVVERLLQLDPQDRYHSAIDLIKAICEAADMPLPTETQDIRESFLQHAPFVGRMEELKQLEQMLGNALSKNRGTICLIGGESGVGKSRLIEELRIRALVNGVLVIHGQAVLEGGSPFELWRPVVRRLILAAKLTELQASILKALVPDIDDLLGHDVQEAPSLTGKSYLQRLSTAIEDIIAQQKQTTLIILEDLHWAYESLSLLQHLSSVQDKLPNLFIVGTYRDNEYPTLPEELPNAIYLPLKRLDETTIAELSTAILGEIPNQEEITALLQRETQGNTLFMIEIVRILAEEAGGLSNIGRLTLPEQVFTGQMEHILQQHLAQLPSKYHVLLQLAAIAGRQINPQLIQHVFPEADIEDWLYICHTQSIIVMQRNQWLFAHDKMREAILRDLSPETKKTLHQQVAEAIEALNPDDERTEALLDHWHYAENLEKEIFYLKRIAKQLIFIAGEYTKAQNLLRRTLSELDDNDPRRIPLLNYLAESHWQSGQVDEAWAAANEALANAEKYHDLAGTARSFYNLGDVTRVKADFQQTRDYYEKSLAIYEQISDEKGITNCLYVLGNTYARMGDYKLAKDYYQRSLERFRALGDLRGTAQALEDLAVVMRVNLELEEALIATQEALSIAQKVGDQRSTALIMNSLGRVYRDLEQYTEAEKNLEQSLELLEKLGDNFGASWTRYNIGLVVQKRRDYDYAEAITRISLEGYEKLEDQYAISLCNSSLGFIRLAQNKFNEAVPFFYTALTLASAINVPPLAMLSMIGFAYIYHQRGESHQVRQLLQSVAHHPSINTEIYFRFNDLPSELATILADVTEDQSTAIDFQQTIEMLLHEFAPDNP